MAVYRGKVLSERAQDAIPCTRRWHRNDPKVTGAGLKAPNYPLGAFKLFGGSQLEDAGGHGALEDIELEVFADDDAVGTEDALDGLAG